ncbi:mitochondrial ribosomal death-associated protein 3-domain-containing protein [Pholiota molesta]|nr:mitochondrial ribosomal death-associated protein 3-domain-containing protein [Pholiota molesta]
MQFTEAGYLMKKGPPSRENPNKNRKKLPPFFIPPHDRDPKRAFGLPRNLWLEFKLLSKPYTVVREITQDAVKLLAEARREPSSNTRVVFTGRPGCGKSFLLYQAVEHCVQQNWIVIYIPRAIDLVNSTTSYAYDIRTQTYFQPFYSYQTLQRMLTINKEALTRLVLLEDLVLEKSMLPKGTSLATVIETAMAEKTRSIAQAPLYLEAVMKTLEAQKQYPVLLAIDDMQTLYCRTAYRDPHFVPIQSYHLSVPRMLLEFASGKRSFQKGAVLGAISASRTSHPTPVELRDALDLHNEDYPISSPYDKRNKTLLQYAEGLRAMEVPEKLTLAEAIGVFEIWKGKQVFGRGLPSKNDAGTMEKPSKFFYDEAFMGKYTESGGNARDFVWKGLLATLDA